MPSVLQKHPFVWLWFASDSAQAINGSHRQRHRFLFSSIETLFIAILPNIWKVRASWILCNSYSAEKISVPVLTIQYKGVIFKFERSQFHISIQIGTTRKKLVQNILNAIISRIMFVVLIINRTTRYLHCVIFKQNVVTQKHGVKPNIVQLKSIYTIVIRKKFSQARTLR